MPAITVVREPTVTILSRPHFVPPTAVPSPLDDSPSDGERLAEFAGRVRTMSPPAPADRSTRDYLETIKTQGLVSVFEHATYSLLLDGVSLSLSHELVRPRSGFSFSERSPRYVAEHDMSFVLPPALSGDTALEGLWQNQMAAALESHRSLVDALMLRYGWMNDKVHRRKIAREAAQGVLPGSAATSLVMTGNARAWRSMLERRAGEQADLEMRRLAILIVRLLQLEAPAFFSDFEVYQATDRREAARVAKRTA
jgi:thymidylate synthase (FAD)